MVVLSESYLQHLERSARAVALTIKIQPKTFKRYPDNSHAGLPSKHQVNIFRKILNKQDPALQYTKEYENGNESLNFLDINIANTNTVSKRYVFKVHRKKLLASYISNQHRVLTLTPSKVYSKVSFTEHTRYVQRNILKKKKKF